MEALGVLKGVYHSAGWQLDARTSKNHYQLWHFLNNDNKVSRHLYRSMTWYTIVISSPILAHSMVRKGLWIKYFYYIPFSYEEAETEK